VPKICSRALITYILWEAVRSIKGEERTASFREQQWILERNKLKRLTRPTLTEIKDALLSTYTLLPVR
jgi:hypothetical protein